jgi:ADP-ribosylglycohydrolase
MNDPLRALWGALIGDACGATLEFYPKEITEKDVNHAMTMPGGGMLRVGPGQITDDGELSMALWCVLRNSNPANGYPLEKVAEAYVKWYDSMPFDIGRTCSIAFEAIHDQEKEGWTQQSLDQVLREIKSMSSSSEANGAMMRASPNAVWHAIHANRLDKPHEEVAHMAANAASEDARLSHPSAVTRDANAVYVYAITLLLLGSSPSDTITHIEKYTVCDTVRRWIEESKQPSLGNYKENAGHVHHAFVAALWFLRHPFIGFEEALKMILMKGGDTDTNAAIVGAMVACYQPLSDVMRRAVHTFDCARPARGIQRPIAYGVRYQL